MKSIAYMKYPAHQQPGSCVKYGSSCRTLLCVLNYTLLYTRCDLRSVTRNFCYILCCSVSHTIVYTVYCTYRVCTVVCTV